MRIVEVLSLASGDGWWVEAGDAPRPPYQPIAVFTLAETVDDFLQKRRIIVPLTALQLQNLNEELVRDGYCTISEGYWTRELYKTEDFQVVGQELNDSAWPRNL